MGHWRTGKYLIQNSRRVILRVVEVWEKFWGNDMRSKDPEEQTKPGTGKQPLRLNIYCAIMEQGRKRDWMMPVT